MIEPPKFNLTGTYAWEEVPNPYAKLGIDERHVIGLAFIRSIRQEVVGKDFSFICTIDGRHRSGKSTAAITISAMLDKTFMPNLSKRVCYTPKQILDAIEDMDKNDIRGGCIVVDEAGVSLAADTYHENFAQVLSKIFNVFGYLQPIIFLCLPVNLDVLAKIRRLNHGYWQCSRTSKEYSILRIHRVSPNTMKNKMFFPAPIMNLNGSQFYMRSILLGKPPQFIIDEYEKLSAVRKPQAIKELSDQFKTSEVKAVKEKLDIDAIIQNVVSESKYYLTPRSRPDYPIIDTTQVRFRLKLTDQLAKHVKNEAERILREKVKQNG